MKYSQWRNPNLVKICSLPAHSPPHTHTHSCPPWSCENSWRLAQGGGNAGGDQQRHWECLYFQQNKQEVQTLTCHHLPAK